MTELKLTKLTRGYLGERSTADLRPERYAFITLKEAQDWIENEMADDALPSSVVDWHDRKKP